MVGVSITLQHLYSQCAQIGVIQLPARTAETDKVITGVCLCVCVCVCVCVLLLLFVWVKRRFQQFLSHIAMGLVVTGSSMLTFIVLPH